MPLGELVTAVVSGSGLTIFLAKLLVRTWADARLAHEKRTDEELLRIRKRLHDFANALLKLEAQIKEKNGSDVKLLDHRILQIERAQSADHKRLGEVEDMADRTRIALEARRHDA